MSQIKWYGEKFKRDLEAEQTRRLALAAMVVERQAKRLLGISGTGVRGPQGNIIRAVKRTKKTIYGAFPSRPGEPPRKQTGALRRSVTWAKITSSLARVGTNFKYGRWLELGTWKMAARPWLVRALREVTPQIKQILTAPWKWAG